MLYITLYTDVPPVPMQVDPTCRYDNIVYIEGFDNCFQLAGGINLPKVLSCSGSDGKRRRQLVKVCTTVSYYSFNV